MYYSDYSVCELLLTTVNVSQYIISRFQSFKMIFQSWIAQIENHWESWLPPLFFCIRISKRVKLHPANWNISVWNIYIQLSQPRCWCDNSRIIQGWPTVACHNPSNNTKSCIRNRLECHINERIILLIFNAHAF